MARIVHKSLYSQWEACEAEMDIISYSIDILIIIVMAQSVSISIKLSDRL